MYFLSHVSIHAFFTFPLKFHLIKKFKLSIKDYLLLFYTFMCMIIFLRIMILSFQSHQTRILTAGLGMAWNRHGLSCNRSYNLSKPFPWFRACYSSKEITFFFWKYCWMLKCTVFAYLFGWTPDSPKASQIVIFKGRLYSIL